MTYYASSGTFRSVRSPVPGHDEKERQRMLAVHTSRLVWREGWPPQRLGAVLQSSAELGEKNTLSDLVMIKK